MAETKQVRVSLVQFSASDDVLINVHEGVVLDDASLIEKAFVNVRSTQTALGVLAVSNGVSADRWGNPEVSAVVAADARFAGMSVVF